ncbi:MAG: FHA domain-containing protein [Chloroflexota bacterium]
MSNPKEKPITIPQADTNVNESDTVNISDELPDEILERNPDDLPALANFWCIALRIIEQNIVIVINLNGDLMLGRQREARTQHNFVDLSTYNAHQHGVSRQHAVISLKKNRVVIMDNESSNRTLLNEKKLVPFEYYPLQPGDIIALGRLRLQFDLIFDPFGM